MYCRVRPINDEDNETCVKIVDDTNLMLEIPECSNAYRSGQIKKVLTLNYPSFNFQNKQI